MQVQVYAGLEGDFLWVLFISRGRIPVARAITGDLVSTFIHILLGGFYRAGAHFSGARVHSTGLYKGINEDTCTKF